MSLKKIQKIAQYILDVLDCRNAELSILILNDLQMSKLNIDYLNKTGSTNVIAFPMFDKNFVYSDSFCLLGDVVISVNVAYNEAMDLDIGFMQRFVELLIHGILHLVGYDHDGSSEDALIMEKKSIELMKYVERLI